MSKLETLGAVTLDASALLALLNAEPGAERVAALLDDAVISSVNLAEVIGKLRLAGMPAAACHEAMQTLALPIVAFSETLAYLAAELEIDTRRLGLSFGDRACLATSKHLGRCAITADRQWLKLKTDIEIHSIR